LQLRRYCHLIIAAHRVEEEWHASATICRLAKGVVDFSGCDDGVWVGISHPVDGGVDVMV